MKENAHYKALGMMSGTSLDGLDIVYCEFEFTDKKSQWSFFIKNAETINFPDDLKERLTNCMTMSGLELSFLDSDLGSWYGRQAKAFIEKYNLSPGFIASHGHTVFHQPERGLTLQIGNGHKIAIETGLEVVNDFRSADVALGGEGAPLVPIGDKLLFSEYAACVNIGGISNISFDGPSGQRTAYDIGPANIVLNRLSRLMGKEYDDEGSLAKKGKCDDGLFEKLDRLSYFKAPPPKSLGYEWIEDEVFPLLEGTGLKPPDLLRTFTEHMAQTMASGFSQHKIMGKALFTGGGAHNKFLISEIKRRLDENVTLVVPSDEIVNFKEALVFAFLGVLRKRKEVNCLSSVTGARADSCGGQVFHPPDSFGRI